MSRTISSEEIERLLPPHVGKSPLKDGRPLSARERLLAVLEILRVFSDDEEGLTAKEIARIIGLLSGSAPSENTVLDDLRALSDNPPFGMEIKAASKGDKKGFRCVQRFVTPDEAAVLVNLVKTCKYLSPDQREKLSGKIVGTMPERKQDEVVGTVYVDERQTSDYVDVFRAANAASKAINEGRTVTFRYVSHLMNGSIYESEEKEETPIALIYSFGHYYLETCVPTEASPDGEAWYRRLDRMKDVAIGRRTRCAPRMQELSHSVIRDVTEKFDMYGDGVCRTLFLRVEGSHAKYVYDAFGNDVKFEHIDEEAAVGYVCIRVQLSPTFFRWLFGMSPKVSLFCPRELTWARRFNGLHNCNQATLALLVEDYRAATKLYLDKLTAVRNDVAARTTVDKHVIGL